MCVCWLWLICFYILHTGSGVTAGKQATVTPNLDTAHSRLHLPRHSLASSGCSGWRRDHLKDDLCISLYWAGAVWSLSHCHSSSRHSHHLTLAHGGAGSRSWSSMKVKVECGRCPKQPSAAPAHVWAAAWQTFTSAPAPAPAPAPAACF